MATCGYLCPKCEGKGFLDNLIPCDWCLPEKRPSEEDVEKWMKQVHEGPCCGDPREGNENF